MSHRIAVVGAGVVGARIARDVLLPPAPDPSGADRGPVEVLLCTRREARRAQLAAALGPRARVVDDADGRAALGPDRQVDVVVLARGPGEQLELARAHLEAGHHVVCTSDEPDEVAALLALDGLARRVGRTVVVGAAMSPGLSCLLAAHASGLLDTVEEIHVARHGAAGPSCARQRLRALRGTAVDWRDRAWVRRPGFSGRELDWFPDPVGARDCYRAELAEPLLLQPAFPEAGRITARLAASRRDRALAPFPVLVPPPSEGGIGAVRVELRGSRDGERACVVYGALDRPAVASAAVAAVAALRLAAGEASPGATGLAGLGATLPLLTELARRGVRTAAFDGIERAESAQVAADVVDDAHVE